MKTNTKDNAKKLRDMFAKMNYAKFCGEFSKVMFGLEEARDMAICCLLGGRHLLLDSAPGYGKTMFVNVIASLTDMKFTKLQLSGDKTSDDVLGIEIPVPIMRVNLHERSDPNVELSSSQTQENKDRVIETLKRVGALGNGTQWLLGDEISRWSPDAVNAVFSALEEGYFKLGDKEYKLEALFTMLATRNVFDLQGVRSLSLAFLDRNGCSVMLERPSLENERKIICQPKDVDLESLEKVWKQEDILEIRNFVSTNYFFDDKGPIVDYIGRLLRKTDPILKENESFIKDRKLRKERTIYMGASPRAGKIFAGLTAVYVHCILGEKTVYPEHIQNLIRTMLRHRLSFKAMSEAQNLGAAYDLIDEVIGSVPILGG